MAPGKRGDFNIAAFKIVRYIRSKAEFKFPPRIPWSVHSSSERYIYSSSFFFMVWARPLSHPLSCSSPASNPIFSSFVSVLKREAFSLSGWRSALEFRWKLCCSARPRILHKCIYWTWPLDLSWDNLSSGFALLSFFSLLIHDLESQCDFSRCMMKGTIRESSCDWLQRQARVQIILYYPPAPNSLQEVSTLRNRFGSRNSFVRQWFGIWTAFYHVGGKML